MPDREALLAQLHRIDRDIADLRTGLVYPDGYAEWQSTASLINDLKTRRAQVVAAIDKCDAAHPYGVGLHLPADGI